MLPDARVGGGVTAPRGGLGGVPATTWVRGMAAAHAKLDAYAHHPYPSTPAETPSSGGCKSCPSITMATIRKLLALVKRYMGPKPIWLTEYGYQSNPPDTFLGVPLKRQANMVSLAAMRVWRLPRVAGCFFQYLYRDERVLSRFQPPGSSSRTTTREPTMQALQAAVHATAAPSTISDGALGSDPQRAARAEDVPAGGAPQEQVGAGRPRPYDRRHGCLQADGVTSNAGRCSVSTRPASGATAFSCGPGEPQRLSGRPMNKRREGRRSSERE